MGSNPSTIYWIDIEWTIFTLISIFCLKRPKINDKEDEDEVPFFKIDFTQV